MPVPNWALITLASHLLHGVSLTYDPQLITPPQAGTPVFVRWLNYEGDPSAWSQEAADSLLRAAGLVRTGDWTQQGTSLYLTATIAAAPAEETAAA